jgi:hypothetical protein
MTRSETEIDVRTALQPRNLRRGACRPLNPVSENDNGLSETGPSLIESHLPEWSATG